MAKNNIPERVESFSFLQKHSPQIRIWHWVTFIFLTASMITVLFASTLLEPWDNVGMVQSHLKDKGVTVTRDQAFAVSHEYEDKMWDTHKLIGYGLAFLLLSRFLIELVLSDEEKFRSRIKNAIGLYKQNQKNKTGFRHYLLVKQSYLFFYVLLLIMTLTGLGMAFGHEFFFLGQIHEVLKTIHSIGQYFMYAFVFLHLSGVIIADIRHSKGIISGMIGGNGSQK